jgi:hypothetical protein
VPHIGDTQSGKWRALPPEIQIKLTDFYWPFLRQFGYTASPEEPAASNATKHKPKKPRQ